MTAAKRQPSAPVAPDEEIVGPAKIHAGHSQQRGIGAEIGRDIGWENLDESRLGRAYASDRIEESEYLAGNVYRGFYELRGRSGTTSFVMVDGGRSNTPFTQSQVDAIRIIEKIELYIGQPYATVARKFCGEDFSARDACVAAGVGDPRKTWETVRLALSKVGTAIESLRIPWRKVT